MEKLNNNSIVLCGKKGCCPTLTLNENIVKIKDDYGNEIKITKDQALSVGLAIKEIENNGRK